MTLADLRAAYAKQSGCIWKHHVMEERWYPVGGKGEPSWFVFLIQHLKELKPSGFVLPHEGVWRHQTPTARAEELYRRLHVLPHPL
jgi:hypothetical protein